MTGEGAERYLLVNTGSSSVKLTVWGQGQALGEQKFGLDDPVDLAGFAARHGRIAAVTHRVVHAGDLQRHAVITPAVEAAIVEAAPLAPLHNPMALRYLAMARAAFAAVPQLAAIDTAFFAGLPARAASYALSSEVGPVRRYGFHGLAHQFLARRCRELDERRPRRLVSLQLGAGCSASAILDGSARDTSMGFSPSEGLMMATRSGDCDPGLLVHLVRTRGCSAAELDRLINQQGGLAGVSGHAAMPEVLGLAERGEPRAVLALELYCYRVQKIIGAYAAALGGLDAVVFGGGVGENAAEVRRRILEPLGWLGVDLDTRRNGAGPVDGAITRATSKVHVWVVHVDEAAEMARVTQELLRS